MSQSFVATARANTEPLHQERLLRRLTSRGNGFRPFVAEDDALVLGVFQRQVELRGTKPAIVCSDASLTYRELDQLSNDVGNGLRKMCPRLDGPVVLLFDADVSLFGAIFGVIKAGGFYIALNPLFPQTRSATIVEDSGARLILTERRHEALAAQLASAGQTIVYLDDVERGTGGLAPSTGPDDLVSIIFTSGSTGRPKGATHTQRTLLALVARWTNTYCLGPGDRVTLLASVSVSASFSTLFSVLLNGGTLFPFSTREKGLAALADWIDLHQISIYNSVPSLFRHLMQSIAPDRVLSSVRVYRLGGDSVYCSDWELFKAHSAPGAVLVNSYGSSEVSNVARYYLDADSELCDDVVPIGYPSDGVRIGVVDAGGRMHPFEEIDGELPTERIVGEIVFESRFLSPGYYNGPSIGDRGETVRRYKTGDLAALTPEHGLVHVGRGDSQVKISGFRVEIAEVESVLRTHPSVLNAAVVVATPAHGERNLVGFVTLREQCADSGAGIRSFATAKLPGYMVPADVVVVDQMPWTPNGKIDRPALLKMREGAAKYAVQHPPATPEEMLVAGIWRSILKRDEIDAEDNFFSLGGNSLFALRVFNDLRPYANGALSLRTLFEHATIRQLAVFVDRTKLVQQARHAIPVAPRTSAPEMSYAQQRLWFLSQMGGVSAAYHIPLVVQLRGALDREALRRALDRIVYRHEALRTTFDSVSDTPVQRIAAAENARFSLVEDDLRGRAQIDGDMASLIASEAGDPFDLAAGPLVRGRLVREDDTTWTLLVTMHHIVSDGWSSSVFFDELSVLYEAFTSGRPDPYAPLSIQYADYSAWQRAWMESPACAEQAQFWRTTLAGAPALLELPADRPRPLEQDYRGAYARVELDETLTAALNAFSRRHDVTLFTTLLTGWAILLSRLTGQDDIVIGTPVANRGYAEIEPLIGLFVNTVALRLNIGETATVEDLLLQVRDRALAAQQHQDIPFERVVELIRPARSLAHSPVFQVMFAWNNTAQGRLRLPGIDVGAGSRTPPTVAKFDLMLSLREAGATVVGGIRVRDIALRRRHDRALRGLLATRAPIHGGRMSVRSIGAISLMSPAERQRILIDWNDTARPIPEVPLHVLFALQAAKSPGADAVAHGDRTWSYADLDRRANQLAHALRARGVVDGSRVAVLLERSFELIAAELAILKCGGTYVPLDLSHPVERLCFLVEDSGVSLVVADGGTLAEELSRMVGVVDPGESAGDGRAPPASGVTGRDAAYVMYTSGSSGQPKGVIVPHCGVIRLTVDNGFLACGPGEAVAFASNVSFDLSTLEVWMPLLNGARIVVIDQATLLSPAAFGDCLDGQGVTVLWMTVGLFNQYADALLEAFAKLRYLIVGGDALDATVIRRVLLYGRPRHLVNGYGPTETTTFASTHEIVDVAADARTVPIGRPIGNTRIYILDGHGEPVPVGVIGELHVGGAGVALGYLNRPELTAERFIASPFVAGDRLYKTGDLGRWLPDGTIDFAGRNDGQVKIRGFRVELGEIEACLRGCAGVGQAVVALHEDAGDKRLVAYYTASDETAPGVEQMRAHLSTRLPEYMIPAAYMQLESLPLSPSGKIDRKALPAVGASAFAIAAYEAPQGEIECALASVWAGLLKLERVGRHDNFFTLGGHSLLAVRVVNAIRRMRSVDISLREVFARPVLSDLAAFVQASSVAELPLIARAERPERIPLSFSQQRLWSSSQIDGAQAAYHTPLAVQLRGNLNRDVLQRSLDRIVFRHEVLRTTFDVVDGMPFQRVQPAEDAHLPMFDSDLRGHADLETELDRLIAAEAKAPFDLVNGPVIRGRLLREDESTFTLLLTMHHIVADGWSVVVLLDELSALYHAFAENRADPLPPLAVQYADYALWQRAWMGSDVLADQARYWKERLTGAPELLNVPADRARPVKQDYHGAFERIELDEELTSKIRDLSRRHDTTVFMTLLAGWSIVLSRLTDQDDVVVGTPVANRGYPEVEPLIGSFVNSLVLRLNLAGAPTIATLLAQVKDRTLGAQQRQDIPFEQVVELVDPARSLAYSPLFQNYFAWNNRPTWSLELPDLECGGGHRSPPSAVKFDLTLSLQEQGPRITGGFEYATALWDATTIARFGEYLRVVLTAMVADDAQRIDRIPVMPQAERELVVAGWNDTSCRISETTLHELFEERAANAPDAVAVVFEDARLTYGELNARANRMARYLRSVGVAPDTRVALCVERSLEMVVGLLAVLKAGGAYVPLDPSYPLDRLSYMLEDSAPVAVLTHAQVADDVQELLQGCGVAVLDFERDASRWAAEPSSNLDRGALRPEHLAYVIYTSDTTGRPNGVMVAHANVSRLFAATQGWFHFDDRDVWTLFHSFAFDFSVWEIWGALVYGGRLVVVPQSTARSPEDFYELVCAQGVTILNQTPSAFRRLMAVQSDGARAHRLREVVFGGEALDPAMLAPWFDRAVNQGVRLVNMYGITETTVHVTYQAIEPQSLSTTGGSLIGRRLPDLRVYIVDDALRPVPIGVAGELYVGGAGVARGYLHRAELTAERFIASPFVPGDRLYKTGDLARYLPDGTIEYLGRKDFQVKPRGFRIELGEVVDRERPLALSFAQQRLWFLAQMEGVSEAYHVRLGLRLRGELDRTALRNALDALTARHESLRTTFAVVDGEPVQCIGPAERGFLLLEHDLRGHPHGAEALAELQLEEATAAFDLEAGPLVRGRLIRVADSEHVLLITMHHIVSDGWSMGVLLREFSALYRGYRENRPAVLPPLQIQYADYAAWQREHLSGAVLQGQVAYWQEALAGIPELHQIPTDRPRPPQQEYAGECVHVDIDAELTRKLKALSHARGTTLFTTLLTAWGALLSRLSGQDDVVIGAPVANRTRTEIEGLIGFFVNTLALRVHVSADDTVGSLLEHVKAQTVAGQERQDVPFEQVVEALAPPRSLAHTPLFQVMFAWKNNETGDVLLPALDVTRVAPPTAVAKFDLMLGLAEADDRIAGSLDYACALFDRSTIERYVGYLHRVLAAMVADQEQLVSALPLLSPAERHQVLVEWNATDAAYPSARCMHELFEAQVAKSPDAVAVVYEDTQLTYAELNARSNQLARYLRSIGVGPDTRVALCVERSLEMVVGLLAVLKAGGAYVPLEPSYPLERVEYMLADSAPVAVLTHAAVPRAVQRNAARWAPCGDRPGGGRGALGACRHRRDLDRA